MRKIFELTHPKIKPARVVEKVKHEIKKYLKRERRKTLPEGADFCDFDCKFGNNADDAEVIHLSEINKRVDLAEQAQLGSFYLEILAKPGYRVQGDDKEESSDLSGELTTD